MHIQLWEREVQAIQRQLLVNLLVDAIEGRPVVGMLAPGSHNESHSTVVKFLKRDAGCVTHLRHHFINLVTLLLSPLRCFGLQLFVTAQPFLEPRATLMLFIVVFFFLLLMLLVIVLGSRLENQLLSIIFNIVSLALSISSP